MRVIFNVDAISAPLTGIGRYALELANGLARHADIESLRLYSAVRWVEDPAEALSSNQLFAGLRKNLPFKTRALETYASLRDVLFRAHTRKLKDYLLHTPNYILMPFAGPSVTTVPSTVRPIQPSSSATRSGRTPRAQPPPAPLDGNTCAR